MAEDRKLVYIAGPVTNGGTRPVTDAIARFREASLTLIRMGYDPVNPLEVNAALVQACLDDPSAVTPENWIIAMRDDIRALMSCEGIYLLNGWENSRGARLEKLIADGLDMFILYQNEGRSDERREG